MGRFPMGRFREYRRNKVRSYAGKLRLSGPMWITAVDDLSSKGVRLWA